MAVEEDVLRQLPGGQVEMHGNLRADGFGGSLGGGGDGGRADGDESGQGGGREGSTGQNNVHVGVFSCCEGLCGSRLCVSAACWSR
ncbi:hypothetical protein ACLVWQ_40480 [Streptomyces sp. CWNU-52B]|uniref:hypothetical protein n=1 Tax=unclassified Streptomyces TaxID=2593676 RepID=UPI0039BF0401